jgi:hypothetical protein
MIFLADKTRSKHGAIVGRFAVHPLAPLFVFSVALTGFLLFYLTAGIAPSYAFQVAASLAWAILVAMWVVEDARRRTSVPCYDFGFICYLLLPIAIPWYCFSSRGWRGAGLLLMNIAFWVGPQLVVMAIWLLRYRVLGG